MIKDKVDLKIYTIYKIKSIFNNLLKISTLKVGKILD